LVKLLLRYGDFSIFQDGGGRHLGFSNFRIFNHQNSQEGQTEIVPRNKLICTDIYSP